MKIIELQKIWESNKIYITVHARKRMKERKISFEETRQAVVNGEIIETYMSSEVENGWLIAGQSDNKRMLHVVIIKAKERYLFVTVYEPTVGMWSDNFKRRGNMKINICDECDLVDSSSTYFEEKDNQFFIIKNVPSLKCKTCGEISYGVITMEIIENFIKNYNDKNEVVVIDFKNCENVVSKEMSVAV